MSGTRTSGDADCANWSFRQGLAVVLASVAFLVEGLGVPSVGLAIPGLIRDWHLPREAFASVAAIGLVGFAVGAAGGGFLADKIGRRVALIAAVSLVGAATLASAAAETIASLCAIRFVVGLGMGAALSAGTTLMSEVAPAGRRGMAIAVGMGFLGGGGVIGGLLSATLQPSYGWRGLFVAIGAIGVVWAVCLVFLLPESPQFATVQLGRRSSDAVARSGLFAAARLGDTLRLWGCSFFLVMAFYSVFSWMPLTLARQGLTVAAVGGVISAFSVGGVLGNFLGSGLLSRFGSRIAVVTLTLGVIVASAALTAAILIRTSDFMPFAAGAAVLGAGLCGIQTGVYALAAEIYPPSVRTTGIGAVVAVGRVGAILSSYTGVAALGLAGGAGYFFSVAIAVVLSMAFVLPIRPRLQARG